MDDLISRLAAITLPVIPKEYREYQTSNLDDAYEQGWNDLQKCIESLPSAQKKGHWRNYEGTLTCSVCETEFDNGIMEYCGDDVPMFCPNCGADMRGNEDAER